MSFHYSLTYFVVYNIQVIQLRQLKWDQQLELELVKCLYERKFNSICLCVPGKSLREL